MNYKSKIYNGYKSQQNKLDAHIIIIIISIYLSSLFIKLTLCNLNYSELQQLHMIVVTKRK